MKKHAPLIARVLLGFVFFGAGLAGLLNAMPPPADMPAAMSAFMAGMLGTKYFFPLLKLMEVICGALLMSGYYVPLALVVLAPIVINIVGVHAFLAPDGLGLALVLGALEAYLAFFSPYSPKIKALFRAK